MEGKQQDSITNARDERSGMKRNCEEEVFTGPPGGSSGRAKKMKSEDATSTTDLRIYGSIYTEKTLYDEAGVQGRTSAYSTSSQRRTNPSQEKSYTCYRYGCTFNSNCRLNGHIRTHSGEKHFTCDSCDYRCSTSGVLRRHMRTHTGEKPFTCESCDLRCSTGSALKIHMRIHTGEKPFACDSCNYTFSQASHFRRHMRTHTGEKPFTCDSCD